MVAKRIIELARRGERDPIRAHSNRRLDCPGGSVPGSALLGRVGLSHGARTLESAAWAITSRPKFAVMLRLGDPANPLECSRRAGRRGVRKNVGLARNRG